MIDFCPKCGNKFDTETDEIVCCPQCLSYGSTACCYQGGRNYICQECECGDENES